MFEPPALDKKVVEFCKENKYDVRIHRISPTSCLTVFPDNILSKKPFRDEYISYTIEGGNVTKSDGRESHKYNLPKYIGRAFILQDIFIRCRELNIPVELCSGYNEKDEILENLIDVFDKPKDLEKENLTIKLASLAFRNENAREEAQRVGVLEGFDIIVGRMLKS